MRKLYEPVLPLHELIEMLRERQSRFRDQIVPAENLRIDDQTANLVVRNGSTTEHEWQPQAFSLLCSKLRVPASYASRCRPWLQAENFNAWLRANPSRQFLLRFDGDEVRAVLSPKYQPVSNLQLAETIQRHAGNIVVRAEVDALQMLLQVVGPGGTEVSRGDRLHGGLHVANSEVGYRAVEMKAMIYRILCTNGLILGGGEMQFRRKHLKNSQDVLAEFGRLAVRALEEGTSLPNRMGDTRYVRIADPDPVFNRIAQRYELQDEELEAVRRAFLVEPESTLYGVINGLTRAGNDPVLSVESRERCQEVGGRILELASKGTRWLDQ